MTIVVPYDGTELSQVALRRASKLDTALGMELRAITAIPNSNEEYAIERGWLDEGERFDPEKVYSRLAGQVLEIAPEATFDYVVVGQYAQAGAIASEIRDYAVDVDAKLVVIGSDNAGNIVSSVSSVGRTVATEDSYDVLIVRQGEEYTEED
jgi:nucleotide-binding universal stress UspA family protein